MTVEPDGRPASPAPRPEELDGRRTQSLAVMLQADVHNRRVWDVFAAKVAARVRRQCGRKLPPDRVDEVCQEVLLRVFRNIRDYDPGKCEFRGWLYTMTKHVLCDELRALLLERQSRGAAGAALEGEEDPHPGPAQAFDEEAPDPEMEQAIREALTGEALARACGSCDPQTLETFRLLVFERRSYDEVARLLNTPVGTLHTRVSRVRDRIEDDLKRRHGIALGDLHEYIARRYKLELDEVRTCGLGPRDKQGGAAGHEPPRPEEA